MYRSINSARVRNSCNSASRFFSAESSPISLLWKGAYEIMEFFVANEWLSWKRVANALKMESSRIASLFILF